MKVIIDRFEEDFAVVELPNKTMVDMPAVLIPKAKEGDVISIDIDQRETNILKFKSEKLMGEVFND